MNWKNQVLVSIDDISVYYNVINMVSPQKILDIGMFLKRIGAVSRKNLNVEMKDTILLDGIDFMEDLDILVMKKIYNNIFSVAEFENFLKTENDQMKEYDLVVMLYPETGISVELEKLIWNRISKNTKYILTNLEPQETRNRRILLPSNTKDVLELNDRYALFVLNQIGCEE